MKPFQSYIYELNKPYEFRIKLANIEPKGDVMEQIKNALNTFELVSASAVKSLPIQEHREFPRWGACECWQFDVKISYPTTATGVRQIMKERARLNPDWICVRNLNEATDTDEAEAYGKDHEGALLLDGELKDVAGGQDLVGEKRKDNMLKELDAQSPKMVGLKSDPALTSTRATERTKPAQTTNQLPQGNTSPIGNHKPKLPPIKGKK